MPAYQFNAMQVPPQQPMEPIPASWQPVRLTKTEAKASNKNKNNGLLACEVEVIDGQYKGRKGFINLNLWYVEGENPEKVRQTVDIAHKELSALCWVCGRPQISNTDELLNIPFMAQFTVVNGRNEIAGYKDMQGNDPGKQGGGGVQQPQGGGFTGNFPAQQGAQGGGAPAGGGGGFAGGQAGGFGAGGGGGFAGAGGGNGGGFGGGTQGFQGGQQQQPQGGGGGTAFPGAGAGGGFAGGAQGGGGQGWAGGQPTQPSGQQQPQNGGDQLGGQGWQPGQNGGGNAQPGWQR